MSDRRRHRIGLLLANCCFLVTTGMMLNSDLRGDTVLLKNGRRLEGRVRRSPTEENDSYVLQLAHGVLVRIPTSDVGRVDKLTKNEQRYAQLLPDMPDTARGHFTMARWCQENGLKDQKDLHLEEVVRHDPNHREARKMLGHSLDRGKWGRPEDHMGSQGYERHRGSLRLPEQIALEEQERATELAQKKWRREIRRWRGWKGRQAAAGRQNIASITDPMAAPGLAELMAKEADVQVRRLYLDVLGGIDAPAAVGAMIHTGLHDDDIELRLLAIDMLRERGSALAMDSFIRSLASKDNRMVRRAGVALGRLGDTRAVRPLIDALVTSHTYVSKPQSDIRPSFSSGADGSSGFNGLSVGGGPRKITRNLQNKAVLDALIALTDQNYRYSESDWKRWYIRQRALPETVNLRRDF